jgi:dTDP-4-amino-4,6-dideoxyglucose formyltransferase
MTMAYKRVLVLSDNERILSFFTDLLIKRRELSTDREFHFACSPMSKGLNGKNLQGYIVTALDVKSEYQAVVDTYDLVISAHCKQIFPEPLVSHCRCINIHPGLNPYNRGWYPQVFSIINGLPLGATIHEIDADLDHGKIIAQKEVMVNSWDTSLDAYNRVLEAEYELLKDSIDSILSGTYESKAPIGEGNINYKKDFEALRKLDLDKATTYREVINHLRGLSHGDLKNAYFIDPLINKKVYVRLILEKETN